MVDGRACGAQSVWAQQRGGGPKEEEHCARGYAHTMTVTSPDRAPEGGNELLLCAHAASHISKTIHGLFM